MRAIDEDGHSLCAAPRGDVLDGHDERAFRRDVVDDDQARPRIERVGHSRDQHASIADRIGKFDRTDPRTALPGDECGCIGDGSIGVVRDKNLVALFEAHRMQDGVDAGGRILDEDEIAGSSAYEVRHGGRGLSESVRCLRRPARSADEFSQKKPSGLSLDLVAEGLLVFEHAPGRRADGPVIEVRDLGIEHPFVEHVTAERHDRCLLWRSFRCHVRLLQRARMCIADTRLAFERKWII